MLDRETLDRIVELGRVEVLEVEGRKYAPQKLVQIQPIAPEPLKFQSLQGLVDYISEGPDDCLTDDVAVHILSPKQVQAISGFDAAEGLRLCYAEARQQSGSFPFGTFMSQEAFVISMQSLVLPSPTRESLLKIVGAIDDEEVRTLADDGVSQVVSARAGIVLSDRVTLPNPVELQPFRTFREVEQPASNFILRVRKGREGVDIALFEADGGVWELEAIDRVADWLRKHLPTIQVLA